LLTTTFKKLAHQKQQKSQKGDIVPSH